jgi:hypothetical protein
MRIANKRSVKILMLIGGILLLTVVLAWFFQEQLGKSFLNIALLTFIAFLLVARFIGGMIDMRSRDEILVDKI